MTQSAQTPILVTSWAAAIEDLLKTFSLRDSKFEAKLSTYRCEYSKPYDTDQFKINEELHLPIRAITRQNFQDRMSVMRREASTTWSTNRFDYQDSIIEESEEEIFEGDDWTEEQTWRKSRIFEFKNDQIFQENLEEMADVLDLDLDDFCKGIEINHRLSDRHIDEVLVTYKLHTIWTI